MGAVKFLNELIPPLPPQPLKPCLKLYFSSLMLFSICAEAGNLSFPSETLLEAITLCKHQSEVINYAKQKEKEGEGRMK